MSLLDNFIKKGDEDIYKRYPKSKITITIIYIVLLLLLIVVVIRTIRMFWFTVS
jgi:hypothetical protein